MENLGDRIQQAWRSFVREDINASGLRKEIDGLDWDEFGEDDTLYFYVVFDRNEGEPYVKRFEGPMWPGFFQGARASELVAAIPIHQGMTKQDLLEFDAADDSGYYESPEWSDG